MGLAAISGARRGGASGPVALLLLVLAACGPPRTAPPADAGAPAPRPPEPRPLSQVFVLEAAGSQPEDTTLSLPPGERRQIVLRRSAPDFGLFARLQLGDSALRPAPGAEAVRVTLRPVPGAFGLVIEAQGDLGGGSILFSYGAHFLAPAGARERYGSDIHFERWLQIAKLRDDSQVVFLTTQRPGSDMLQAALDGPGRYLVVAPR